jgi:predicted small secreted protein|tara:strand:+ start:176 stop:361 length:186 start_codon:yes stop_codon:yes gene_type:complete
VLQNQHVVKGRSKETMSVLVKRILALALIAGFGMSLAACETAAGFGRDVEKLGEQIQEGTN